MNLGKRIEARLHELTWSRNDLLAKVPELTAQALSNLIVRDSRRSEWDEKIAAALGVSVLWLVYGREDALCVQEKASVYELHSEQIKRVATIMSELSSARQDEVLSFTEERLVLQRAGAQNPTQRAGQ